MPRLERVRLITYYGFERRNSFKKLILPVVGEADVQPDSRNLRQQPLGLAQIFQRLLPLLAPHVNDAKIRVRAAELRIELQGLAKVAFRFVEAPMCQRILSVLKDLSDLGGPSRWGDGSAV